MTRAIEKHPYSAILFAVLAVAILSIGILSEPRTVHSSTSGAAITGYLWSDTIGWVDMNCANSSVCGSNPFGMSIDSSGNITGYAWSDNVGWISANPSDLSGCPSAPCTATISGSSVSGWLKAISADNNGWDGWISLSGSGYGVTSSSGAFAGYAWGSDVVGWLDWSKAKTAYGTCTASTVYSCSAQTIVSTATDANCNVTTQNVTTCTAPSFCTANSAVCLYPSPSAVGNGNLTLTPSLVPSGKTTQVSWNIANVQSCKVSGTNADGTAQSTDTNSAGVWTGLSGAKTSSAIGQQVTYTLSCVVDDPNAPAFVETATANVVPTYQER
jgi:hypothetical protein